MFAERDCLINGPFIETNLIFDKTYLKQIRLNVEKFIKSIEYDPSKLYLEIGPSEQYFNASCKSSKASLTYISPSKYSSF